MAHVHFGLAPLPSESGRTGAGEIVNQVGAIATQQARGFGVERTSPSGRADAFETTLFQLDALGGIGARIGGAGVQGAAAVGTCVARPAEAGELALSGLVLAHGPAVAGRPRCSWTVPPGTEGRNSRAGRSTCSLSPGRDRCRRCSRAGRRSRRC